MQVLKNIFFISFTLYPAYSMVSRGNLVLRHSVPNFPSNFSRHCVLSGKTQHRTFALVATRRNETIIHSLDWESNPQPPRCSHILVPLRYDGLNIKKHLIT